MIKFSLKLPELNNLKLYYAKLNVEKLSFDIIDSDDDKKVLKKIIELKTSQDQPCKLTSEAEHFIESFENHSLDFIVNFNVGVISDLDDVDKKAFYAWVNSSKPVTRKLTPRLTISAKTTVEINAKPVRIFKVKNQKKLTDYLASNPSAFDTEPQTYQLKSLLKDILAPYLFLEDLSKSVAIKHLGQNVYSFNLSESITLNCKILESFIIERIEETIRIKSYQNKNVFRITSKKQLPVVAQFIDYAWGGYRDWPVLGNDVSLFVCTYYCQEGIRTFKDFKRKAIRCDKKDVKLKAFYEVKKEGPQIQLSFSFCVICETKPQLLLDIEDEENDSYQSVGSTKISRITIEKKAFKDLQDAYYCKVTIVIPVEKGPQNWFVKACNPNQAVELRLNSDHILKLDRFTQLSDETKNILNTMFGVEHNLGLPIEFKIRDGIFLCLDVGTSSMTASIFKLKDNKPESLELVTENDLLLTESDVPLLPIEEDSYQCPSILVAKRAVDKKDNRQQNQDIYFEVLTDKQTYSDYLGKQLLTNLKTYTRTHFYTKHDVMVGNETEGLYTWEILQKAYDALLLITKTRDRALVAGHSLAGFDDFKDAICGIRFAVPNIPVSHKLRKHFIDLAKRFDDEHQFFAFNPDKNVDLVSESAAALIHFVTQSKTDSNVMNRFYQKLDESDAVHAVLVDVGAGTTDISLADIKQPSEKLDIRLVGGSSTDMAGNFFDLIIAQAVYSEYFEQQFLVDQLSNFVSKTVENNGFKKRFEEDLLAAADYCLLTLIINLDIPVTEFKESNEINKESDNQQDSAELIAPFSQRVESLLSVFKDRSKEISITLADSSIVKLSFNRDAEQVKLIVNQLKEYINKKGNKFSDISNPYDKDIYDFAQKIKARFTDNGLVELGYPSPVEYIFDYLVDDAKSSDAIDLNLALKQIAEQLKLANSYDGQLAKSYTNEIIKPLVMRQYNISDLLKSKRPLYLPIGKQKIESQKPILVGKTLKQWVKYASYQQIENLQALTPNFAPDIIILTGRGGLWKHFQDGIKDHYTSDIIFAGLLDSTSTDDQLAHNAKSAVVMGLTQHVFWRDDYEIKTHHSINTHEHDYHLNFYVYYREGEEKLLHLLERDDIWSGKNSEGVGEVFLTNETKKPSQSDEEFYHQAYRIKWVEVRGDVQLLLDQDGGEYIVFDLNTDRNIFEDEPELTGSVQLAHWPNKF